MNETIKKIIDTEWEMFQNVNNVGGRASCQDDRETFYIMRESQYENWSEEMIAIYDGFLAACAASGRNIVTEKYARMMAYTDREYYDRCLKPYLAPVPAACLPLIDEIVAQMTEWEEALAAKYPRLSQNSRPIRAEADKYGFTSMETYARGELATYPLSLLEAYRRHVTALKDSGQSLAENILATMVRLYDYVSIEEAEARG